MMRPDCSIPITSRNRGAFWTTQPNGCGEGSDSCGYACGTPGITFIDDGDGGRTIETSNWVRSLVLNILMTDRRVENSICGVNPAAVKGHWSDSYRADGLQAGSRLRQINFSRLGVNESVALINAHVSEAAGKLVALGVARSVDVVSRYMGNNRVSVEIEPFAKNGGASMGRVAIIGQRSNSNWIWS